VSIAQQEGLLVLDSANLTAVAGKKEAELEDLYDEAVYEDIVFQATGLRLIRNAPDREKKWSDRVRHLLRRAGKPSDDLTIRGIKIRVAQNAAAIGAAAIHKSKSGPIDSLANSLLSKLQKT
jgi:hypothetical protein